MLNAQWHRRSHGVQHIAVQRSGDRVVVAHGADPAVLAYFGARQCGGQSVAIADLRRPDPDRVRRGRRRIQVHMVVVQAGQHGPARCVQHVLAGPWRQRVGDLVDRYAHAQVYGRAIQRRCPLNQHVAQDLSATSRSTAALSAPSGDADGTTAGRRGRSAVAAAPVAGGTPAYRAAAWAIPTSITSPPPPRSVSLTARAASNPLSGSAIASPQKTGPSSPAPTSPPATAASSPN